MTITRNLNWFPAFANEISIEDGDFQITMRSDTTNLEIAYHEEPKGYMGALGCGTMDIHLPLLMELRAELDNSILVFDK